MNAGRAVNGAAAELQEGDLVAGLTKIGKAAAALDAITREELQDDLLQMCRLRRTTVAGSTTSASRLASSGRSATCGAKSRRSSSITF